MKYAFLPSFSLDPCKITSYNSIFYINRENETLTPIQSLNKNIKRINKDVRSSNSVVRDSHNFTISDNAYRTLKRRINWLYYLAKSKRVKTYRGKEIYNFKIGFLTLTLPTKQRTCTADVTSSLLNPFLTEIRTRTNMKNYVWRLEFQKNGNVHYHLVTDTYLDYFFVLRIWNRLLKSKGYIDEYKKKFSKMSLTEYRDFVDKDRKTDFSVIAKRYARGKADNWEQPNSIDIKSVVSNKAIANYISKYFAKENEGNPIKNDLDNNDNSNSLRLWFCSRSLSKLNTLSNFCEAMTFDIFALVSYCSEKREVIGRYAKTIYFNINKFPRNARRHIEILLRNYAFSKNYIPSPT